MDYLNDFEKMVPDLLNLLRRKLELKGLKEELNVLQVGTTDFERTIQGSIGGTYFFDTLYIDIPIELYVEIEGSIEGIEERILQEIESLRRDPKDHHVAEVVIRSAPIPHLSTSSVKSPFLSFWQPHDFKVFISHVASTNLAVYELKKALAEYGITSFVAHEDIEPTKQWREEIYRALLSMNCLVALVTPDFMQSKWCDQEVGIAMGLGRLVIPVRMGADPYGFLGNYQAVTYHKETMVELAGEVFSILATHDMTSLNLAYTIVERILSAQSIVESEGLTNLLASLPLITEYQAKRLRKAVFENPFVGEAHEVPVRIEAILQKHGHKKRTYNAKGGP